MLTYIFGFLSAFCAFHAYRDYLHSKGIKEERFITRVWHWWDAPQYETHGMVGSLILAATFLVLAIK